MRVSLFFALFLIGCKPPPEAPQELDQLVGYLFEHLPDEEPDALEAGVENTRLWLSEHLDDTLEGYTVDTLSDASVDALGDGERDLTELVGGAVGHIHSPTVPSLVDAIILGDPQDIYEYDAFERDFVGDKQCFAEQGAEDESCAWLEAEAWATSNYALGLEVTSHSYNEFRWVESENGPAMIYRTWLREPATVSLDFLAVEQQYFVWLFIPFDGQVRSIQATWVVAKLSSSALGEDLALSMVVDQMSANAASLDAYVME